MDLTSILLTVLVPVMGFSLVLQLRDGRKIERTDTTVQNIDREVTRLRDWKHETSQIFTRLFVERGLDIEAGHVYRQTDKSDSPG